MKWLDWYGCYTVNNKKWYVPEAFSHPAKMAIGLCQRIFDFLEELKAIEKGDIIVDPFGGIGTTGLVGTIRGYRCIVQELEEKFVNISLLNVKKNQRVFEAIGQPPPVIVKGDSRNLSQTIKKEINAIVTSSPYGSTKAGGAKGIAVRGYRNPKKRKGVYQRIGQRAYTREHFSKGNISNLPNGDAQAIITSPTYINMPAGSGGLNTKPAQHAGQQTGRSPSSPSQQADQKYGKTEGQIASLKDKGVETAIITSPPWGENTEGGRRAGKFKGKKAVLGANRGHGASDKAVLAQAERDEKKVIPSSAGQIGKLKCSTAIVTSPPFEDSVGSDEPERRGGLFKDPKRSSDKNLTGTYGSSEGQIGKEKRETYWQAMRTVYIECWKVLKPKGFIAIVVKDFVRNKQRVPLCDNTVKLLENIGFEIIYRARAWTLSESVDTTLFGEQEVRKKERKGFFRRQSEMKAMADKYWNEQISLGEREKWFETTSKELSNQYEKDLREWQTMSAMQMAKAKKRGRHAPIKPTSSRILYYAKLRAWKAAGSPFFALNTRIDFEEVIFARKR